jgi:hypothetical protein
VLNATISQQSSIPILIPYLSLVPAPFVAVCKTVARYSASLLLFQEHKTTPSFPHLITRPCLSLFKTKTKITQSLFLVTCDRVFEEKGRFLFNVVQQMSAKQIAKL